MQYFTDPEKLLPQRVISLDTEYTELDIKKADLLSISIGLNSSTAGVFLPSDLPRIQKVLTEAETVFVANGKVDWYMLKKNGVELDTSRFIDIQLLEHLIDENVGHSLGEMVLRFFGDNYKSEFWGKYSRYQDAPRKDQLDYEMRDACHTFALGNQLLSQLGDSPLIPHVHKLYWALFETEISGLRVDVDLMRQTQVSMKAQIDEYLPKLREDFIQHVTNWELQQWAGEISKRKTDKGKAAVPRPRFNFASDPQIAWLLYESMGCPVVKRTKVTRNKKTGKKSGGNPSTDKEALAILEPDYPELKNLVGYKAIKNIYATFVVGLLERVEDNRIYPSFNVNGTRNAGRISHSDPNMANMPSEGPVRNFFLPEDGNVVIGADYSQLEVVIEACVTEDASLKKIVLDGASKHDITAQGLGVDRDTAKTLNFALAYGAGAGKVAKILKISYPEALKVFARYWEIYSGVRDTKLRAEKDALEKGYVTTLFGRKRHFSKPESDYERAEMARMAYNAIIQGTGADMTNRASWQIHKILKQFGIGRLWFTVHDEIIIEARKQDAEASTEYLLKSMVEPNKFLGLKYPVKAEPYGPLERWAKG